MDQVLEQLLMDVPVQVVLGNQQTKVTGLASDSRKVRRGNMFFALRGTALDGNEFIPQALTSGATVIVCEAIPNNISTSVTYVIVDDVHHVIGLIAANYYGRPAQKMKVAGITGTNGKTTCATLLHKLFRELGYSAGLLSTVQNQINEDVLPASLTTPDPISLQALLAKMAKAGCTHCFMEVSSHALKQKRTNGIEFAGAVFTNISHDHLDYHGNFDNYIAAKKLFFDNLSPDAFALVNTDDKRAEIMLQNTDAKRYTYALRRMADFKGRIIESSMQGLNLEIDGQEGWFKLVGEFNASNLLAVYGAAVLLGEEKGEVLTVLSGLGHVNGRFDLQKSKSGISAIVDYAHTPDALENVLSTIKSMRKDGQKIITIVGCGGDRDSSKRPIMAQIAKKFSDEIILTSDNPRNEDPEEILKQMMAGLNEADQIKVLKITDRKEAIKTACHLAAPNDIILLAGKGHETYQEVKGERTEFDDKKVLKETFELLGK